MSNVSQTKITEIQIINVSFTSCILAFMFLIQNEKFTEINDTNFTTDQIEPKQAHNIPYSHKLSDTPACAPGQQQIYEAAKLQEVEISCYICFLHAIFC